MASLDLIPGLPNSDPSQSTSLELVQTANHLLSHFNQLEDLLKIIHRTRQALPALVRAADGIPHSRSRDLWQTQSQENQRNVQNLKEAVMNAQDAFLYVRSSSRFDSSDLKMKDEVPEQTAAALAYLKTLTIQFSVKTGPEVQRRDLSETERRIRTWCPLRAPEPGFETAIRLVNKSCGMEAMTWRKLITRPERTNWVEINLKGVLRTVVAVREHPDPNGELQPISFIERGVCFGAHERRKRVYEQSCYGIFQAISRCLTSVIEEHSRPGSDNVYLVCTFLASYLNLFQSPDPTAAISSTPSQTGLTLSTPTSCPTLWRVWRRGADDQKGAQTARWDPMEEPLG
ncbi:hypothetical protein CROQUDRAFT_649803 [Cronartium quercuum f. sp. fusiforme G11]|uniref:Uncharacterized protein n=1 Tax=Cronartium quercuum f. sp. fusiforme G11 TaxID=708437 RepID=A0A9P6TI53_9BASI|nr:hypothetical protein CROQUDRAFT_649803 [Cronartium quercuum f. sp. fusiforme G11]